MFLSESARRKALPGWLHEYNHHRPHTALGGAPISRIPVNNVTSTQLAFTGAGAICEGRRRAKDPRPG
jgi:transposase InsO family protein